MPSLRSRAVALPDSYNAAPNQMPAQPFMPNLPTVTPGYLIQSPLMVTSLPAISTTLDGAARQFYNSRVIPVRRVSLPG